MSFNAAHFERTRWTIYGILILAYMLVFFQRIAPAVVSGELMQAFNTTGAALGSLVAMYYYIYTAMQLPSGVLADTLGTRASVAVGNLIGGVGSIIFGLASDFEIAAAGRLMVGFGISVIFVGLMKSNTVWFSERSYGVISGLTLFLGNLGAFLAAKPLAMLLEHYSWRAVFVGLGVFSIFLAIASWIWIRNRPEDAGFPSLREMAGQETHAVREQHWTLDLKQVLGVRTLWAGFWTDFGMMGAYLSFIGLWAIPFLRDTCGVERNAASQYTSISLLSFAVCALCSGWVSDRLGRRKPILVAGALGAVIIWGLFLIVPWQTGWGLSILFALLGVSHSTFVLSYPLAKESISPALSGMALSLVNMGVFAGAAVAQPLFGWILDHFWAGKLQGDIRIYAAADYRFALYAMLGFAVLAFVSALCLRETFGKNVTLTGKG
jgi:sugar phosphate permease